jgi:ankyrin repeat protein
VFDNIDIVRILLSNGASADVTDFYGDNLLHTAVGKLYGDITIELIRFGANVNLTNKSGETPLHIAAKSTVPIPYVVKALLTSITDVNVTN